MIRYGFGMSKCVLCETRKPRRHCVALNGDICSQCCGTSREVTVVCPFECGYLREARIHEKLVDVDPWTFPHQDVKITEGFLVDHEELLLATASALAEGALEANHAYDSDVKEAIEALIMTYRTLIAGVFYEALPNNSVAASIFRRVRERVEDKRDAEVLGVLVFLQRMALDEDNERVKSRRFMDVLRIHFPKAESGVNSPKFIR